MVLLPTLHRGLFRANGMFCVIVGFVACGALDNDGARGALFLVVKEDNGVSSVNGVDDGCCALHRLRIMILLG